MTAIRAAMMPMQQHKHSDFLYRILCTALFLYLTALLLRCPALSLSYASTGLSLWFEKMIPALLPFMILSGIMIRMNLTEQFSRLFHPLLHRLFGTTPNGSYTIIMGFLCGFPMGARIIGELRTQNKISICEAEYLLAFCNNIGPLYFLSFVVSALAIDAPVIPFCIMYGTPLFYGFLLYHIHYKKRCFAQLRDLPAADPDEETPSSPPMPLLAAVDASVISGLVGIAKLGGYMVLFNLLNIITAPFRNLPKNLLYLYNCILEITSGIDRCGQSFALPVLILLPFGGFSCIAQTYSMIQGSGLSIRRYVLHKTAQTLLTFALYAAYVSCRLISLS